MRLSQVAVTVAISVVMSGCGEPGDNTNQPAQESRHPNSGLPKGASGLLVGGGSLYWIGNAVVSLEDSAGEDQPTELINVVRRQAATGEWEDLPPIPLEGGPEIVDAIVVGDALVTVVRDCDPGRLDSDNGRLRECSRTVIATLKADSEWTVRPLVELLKLGADPIESTSSVTLAPLFDRLVVELWHPVDGQALYQSQLDLAAAQPVQQSPTELRTPYALGTACSLADGLLVAGPLFRGASGATVGPLDAGVVGAPSGEEGVISAVVTSRLSLDGTWTAPVVIQGYVPFPTPLGCTDNGMALRARVPDPALSPVDQPIVAVEFTVDGRARELPIELGR